MSLLISAKELIRHGLSASGASRLVYAIKKMRGHPASHLQGATIKDRFSAIYREKIWALGDESQPLSGHGSSLEATKILRAQLSTVLVETLNVKSLLDLGCGDFTWMSTLNLPLEYTGADIVQSVIDANSQRFPQHRFLCIDGTSEALPYAEAVLCREVLFHLSLGDIKRTLSNVRKSGATYLAATSDPITSFNADIVSGDFRVVNFQRAPFRFPEPIARIADDGQVQGRFIGFWRVADLKL